MNSSGDLPKRPKLSWFPNAVIIFILMAAMGFKFWTTAWQKKVIENDVISYYAYLPALFIHHDITLDFMNDTSTNYQDRFWPQKHDNGKYVIKTSMGMSFLYAPFFGLAHAYEKATGGKANGFTSAYRTGISFAALLYLLLGLIMTRKLLRKYFSPLVTGITLLLIVLGTNLFHYATREAGMSHVYSFGLIALFLYINDKWLNKTSTKNSIFVGLLFGIITLARPTNGLIVIFPLLWNVVSWKQFKDRVGLLSKNWLKIIVVAIASLIVWLPQLLYWKMQTGHFFYNSYGESFFFDSFHHIEALFGYRKGWYLYTPIMLVATIGIFFLRKETKALRFSIAVFLIVFIYITFSWWCWWYGGSFSSRPMIDIYAIMAIPFAAITNAAFLYSGKTRAIALFAITLFVFHGFFQSLKYFYRTIHWDSMTREAYFDSFGRIRPSENLWKLLERPDYESAIVGNEEKATMAPLADYAGNKDFLSIQNNIKIERNNEFFTLAQLTIPENHKEIKGRVIVRANSNNIEPNDLFLVASIYNENDIVASAQQSLTIENCQTDFPWEFSLNCPQTSKSEMILKVFLWSKEKKDASFSSFELLLFNFQAQ